MGLIKFRSWINEFSGQAPMPTPAPAPAPNDMMRQLHQQLSDPSTTPEAKQHIMTQLDQLRKGTQANPAQPTQAPNVVPNAAPNAAPPGTPAAPAYRWQNGRPVPAGQV